MSFTKFQKICLISLCLLMVMDVAITSYGLYSGTMQEINPIFSHLKEPTAIIVWLVIGKLISIPVIVILLHYINLVNEEWISEKPENLGDIYIGLITLIFGGFLIWMIVSNI